MFHGDMSSTREKRSDDDGGVGNLCIRKRPISEKGRDVTMAIGVCRCGDRFQHGNE